MSNFAKQGRTLKWTGTLSEFLQCVDNKDLKVKNTINSSRIADWKNPRPDSWAGGTYLEAVSLPDIKPFERMLKQVNQNQFLKDIKESFALDRKRKRIFSDQDGEWQYDKRWDAQPFVQAKTRPVQNKAVEVEVDFAFHCGYSSEQINNYGARIWAFVQILEQAGFTVRLVLKEKGQSFTNHGSNNDISIELKQYERYLSPIALASVLRTVFLRKLLFINMTILADYFGEEASGGLGIPDQLLHGVNYKFEKGKIILSHDFDFNDSKGFMSDLDKFIKQNG